MEEVVVVGIVGYLTPKTKEKSHPEEVILTDEIEALKIEVKKLHDEGTDIIVAIGHSGYDKDKEVPTSVLDSLIPLTILLATILALYLYPPD